MHETTCQQKILRIGSRLGLLCPGRYTGRSFSIIQICHYDPSTHDSSYNTVYHYQHCTTVLITLSIIGRVLSRQILSRECPLWSTPLCLQRILCTMSQCPRIIPLLDPTRTLQPNPIRRCLQRRTPTGWTPLCLHHHRHILSSNYSYHTTGILSLWKYVHSLQLLRTTRIHERTCLCFRQQQQQST